MSNTEGGQAKENKRDRKKFRFESLWTKDKECEAVVVYAWYETGNSLVTDKIHHLQGNLSRWNQFTFCAMRRRIDELTSCKDETQGKCAKA